MQEFQFTIVHRPGKAHGNADALSRRHCGKECPDVHSNMKVVATTTLTGYSTAELQQAQLEDPNIGEILQAKQGNCRASMEHVKSRSLEYHRLLQQWDQLSVMDGVLLQLYHSQERTKGGHSLLSLRSFVSTSCMEV